MQLTGFAAPLSPQGMADVAQGLGTDMPSIWSVVSVETRGCGFLPSRKLQILFEHRKFKAFTNGRYDQQAPGISNDNPQGYGASGEFQYQRLEQALALDPAQAVRATSWGLGQIMGFNAQAAGYDTPEEMVEDFLESEDNQLAGFASFLKTNGLDVQLRNRAWANLARGYNGPSYAQNQYDTKLANFYQQYKAGPMPDLKVRAVQLGLTLLGRPVKGGIDGMYGKNTKDAITAFQQAEGDLAVTGLPDDATVERVKSKVGWV